MNRDEMKKALYEAEEKYRHIFENATEGIFQASTEGRFTSANPALARLHGYGSPSELIDAVTNIRDDLFCEPDRHMELIRLVKEYDTVSNFEACMKRRDKSDHWVSINVRAFRSDEGRILFYEGTMRDITTRKEAQWALAESEERYRTVIEHSNDGIAFVRGGKLEYVNPRFVAMFGYDSPDELVGKQIALHVHPDDRQEGARYPCPPAEGASRPGEVRVPGDYAGRERSSTSRCLPRGSPTATSWSSFSFLRDVSERKRAEKVFLESHRQLDQLNRAKTKAVNHISHELKTPLAVIQGNVRVLRRKLQQACPDQKVEGILRHGEEPRPAPR